MKNIECLSTASLLFFFFVNVQKFLRHLQCSNFAPKSGKAVFVFLKHQNPKLNCVHFRGRYVYAFAWDTLCIFFGTPYVYFLEHPMYIFADDRHAGR